jgi:hypothetical protein
MSEQENRCIVQESFDAFNTHGDSGGITHSTGSRRESVVSKVQTCSPCAAA